MTEPHRFELFTFWRSSATYRVRVACNLKGIGRTETNVDIDAGEQHGEAFRRVNPLGGIPALVDHGPGESALPITQSLAIQKSLRSLNKLLVENHLRTHVTDMFAAGGDQQELAVDEMLRVFELNGRAE